MYCRRWLPRNPERGFDEEDVVGSRGQEGGPITREVQVTERLSVAARLRPGDVDHRSRPVLPAEDRVSAQRLLAEVRVLYRERGGISRAVRVDRIRLDVAEGVEVAEDRAGVSPVDKCVRRARCRVLLEVEVPARAEERLNVELE